MTSRGNVCPLNVHRIELREVSNQRLPNKLVNLEQPTMSMLCIGIIDL